MVKIQCNYPNGVTLQLRESQETVTIYGFLNAEKTENGYGITENVDKEFWDKWVEENKQYPILTNGCISANTNVKKATKEASSNSGTVSGIDQVPQPKNDTV